MRYEDIKLFVFSCNVPRCCPAFVYTDKGSSDFDAVLELLKQGNALEQELRYGSPESEGASWTLQIYSIAVEDIVFRGKGCVPDWFKPVYDLYMDGHRVFNIPKEESSKKYENVDTLEPVGVMWDGRPLTQAQADTMFYMEVDSGYLVRGHRILRRLGRPVQQDDWNCLPMPASSVIIEANIKLTKSQEEAVRWGFLPYELRDRWFICCVGDELRIHSSWSGYAVYFARMSIANDGWTITEVVANKDEAEVEIFTEEQDLLILEALITQLDDQDANDIMFRVLDLEEGPEVSRHLRTLPNGDFCPAHQRLIDERTAW